MQCVVVDILAGEMTIGTAELLPADPSMGVAGGIFRPNATYRPELHAQESEAFGPFASPAVLSARDGDGSILSCAGVNLVDFSPTLGDEGRELHVLGMDDYEAYFGTEGF
jgi:hypothetical protein